MPAIFGNPHGKAGPLRNKDGVGGSVNDGTSEKKSPYYNQNSAHLDGPTMPRGWKQSTTN